MDAPFFLGVLVCDLFIETQTQRDRNRYHWLSCLNYSYIYMILKKEYQHAILSLNFVTETAIARSTEGNDIVFCMRQIVAHPLTRRIGSYFARTHDETNPRAQFAVDIVLQPFSIHVVFFWDLKLVFPTLFFVR